MRDSEWKNEHTVIRRTIKKTLSISLPMAEMKAKTSPLKNIMEKGDNMMAMVDVQRKSWQTKARTSHIALSYDDMDKSKKIHSLKTSNVNFNHGIKNLDWSILMT